MRGRRWYGEEGVWSCCCCLCGLYILDLKLNLSAPCPRTSTSVGNTTALSRHAAWLKRMRALSRLPTTAGAHSGTGPKALSRRGGRLNILFILCASGCWNGVGGPARKITVSTASGERFTRPPSICQTSFVPLFRVSFMRSWPCPVATCRKVCRSPGGLTQHLNSKHRHHEDFGRRETAIHRVFHPLLDGG